jgi:hypothetical protein
VQIKAWAADCPSLPGAVVYCLEHRAPHDVRPVHSHVLYLPLRRPRNARRPLDKKLEIDAEVLTALNMGLQHTGYPIAKPRIPEIRVGVSPNGSREHQSLLQKRERTTCAIRSPQ